MKPKKKQSTEHCLDSHQVVTRLAYLQRSSGTPGSQGPSQGGPATRLDASLHPSTLHGSKTGSFLTATLSHALVSAAAFTLHAYLDPFPVRFCILS